jgi:hypothetical protein
MSYQEVYCHRSNAVNPAVILRTTDGSWIPTDPANADYQEYLEWVAEGNTPEPADSEEE